MNPLLIVAAVVAFFALKSKPATSQPVTVALPPVPVPPGTMTQSEVNIIQRGNPDELVKASIASTHKTFVAAAAARLAGLGDARSIQVAQYAAQLPNQEDTP